MPSVGLKSVGAQVGSATWAFCVGGAGRAPWSWSEGPPPVRELSPARLTKSGRLSRNIPVHAMSMTTGGWLDLESGLEHELMMSLDRLAKTAWLVGQPARLKWEDGVKHFPDLLSVDRDGSVTIWDVRPPQRRDETFLAVSSRTAKACAEVGWVYELFGGFPEATSLNLRWLAGARRPPEWLGPARDVLRRVVVGDTTKVGDVLDADDGRGYLTSSMWHLVWTGELSMDLAASWGRPTAIAWADAAAGAP